MYNTPFRLLQLKSMFCMLEPAMERGDSKYLLLFNLNEAKKNVGETGEW